MARPPAIGWVVLMGVALAASIAPLLIQLGFAIVAIGIIGMAHGASDLAIVERRRKPLFLFCYVVVSTICLIWWTICPRIALPLFLIASAIHFGMEDAPHGSFVERAARGIGLVTIPAVFHRDGYATILSLAAGASVPVSMTGIIILGAGAAAILLPMSCRRRGVRLFLGIGALLAFPPLIGFSLGFLILHALPQTDRRRAQIGCASHGAYLQRVGPVLIAALGVAALVAMLFLRFEDTGIRALFAAIAALAMPHLLVTPWFESHGIPPSRTSGHRRISLSS